MRCGYSHGPSAPRRVEATLLSAVAVAASSRRGGLCSAVWRTVEWKRFGVALVGNHRILTGYSRNTVSVRQVFRDVLLWTCPTVSRRVLQHAGHSFVHPVGVGVLTRSVRTPPSAECKEAHSPARPVAAVLSDCAVHCDLAHAQRRHACRRARPRRPTSATPTRPRRRHRRSRRRAGRTLPTRRVRPLPVLYREGTVGYSVTTALSGTRVQPSPLRLRGTPCTGAPAHSCDGRTRQRTARRRGVGCSTGRGLRPALRQGTRGYFWGIRECS